MDYQTVAKKISDFITFKSQIISMEEELKSLVNNPPRLEKEVLTWEEAIAFSESTKKHGEQMEKLRMGIANRQNIIQNREEEIGKMLPVQDLYILFKIMVDGQEETYKIGYFPSSYGFRMEKMPPESESPAS